MTKTNLTDGNHEGMLLITEFLIQQGFTPVYELTASKWEDDSFGVHDEGRGWRSFKGDREWRCVEPIPRNQIEDNFELPATVRICSFPDAPEVGISLASDSTYESITSTALEEQLANPAADFSTGV